MSYLGTGDWTDIITAGVGITKPSDEIACLNRANNSPQVLGIDAIIDRLSKTWNPTGYYRPADVQSVLTMLEDEAQKVGQVLAGAPSSTSDAAAQKSQAFADVLRRYRDRSIGYVQAVSNAKATGAGAINAPGLKDWVLSSMRAISDAYVTAAVLHCRQTWAEAVLDKAYGAISGFAAVVGRIGGIAASLAGKIVDAVDTAAGITGAIIKYAPYAALGVGAYFLYNLIKKRST